MRSYDLRTDYVTGNGLRHFYCTRLLHVTKTTWGPASQMCVCGVRGCHLTVAGARQRIGQFLARCFDISRLSEVVEVGGSSVCSEVSRVFSEIEFRHVLSTSTHRPFPGTVMKSA